MKKIILSLFSLIFLLGAILKPEAIFASNGHIEKQSKHLEYYWSGNDQDLYLNIDLFPGLVFGEKYHTINRENDQECEVFCKPIEGQVVLSSEGHQLQEISIIVQVMNTNNPNEVNFKITIKSFYEGVNKEGQEISVKRQWTREGRLNNPSLDVTQTPEFFTINDEGNKGVVNFKTLLPYKKK